MKHLGAAEDPDTMENKGCRKMFKIGCFSVGGLFLVLLIAAISWFFYVTQEVEIHDKDMVVEFRNVSEEENGCFSLEKARQAVVESGFDTAAFCVTNKIPSSDNLVAYRKLIKEYPDVLNNFYAVAGYEYCQAPFNPHLPAFKQKHMRISGLITLGFSSLCNIEDLLRKERTGDAITDLESHMRIGQMINSGALSLIEGMMGLVLNQMAKDLFIYHLSNGTFSDADYDQIVKMIVSLDSEGNWNRMIRAEYTFSKSVAQSLGDKIAASSNLSPRFRRYLYNEPVVLNQFADFFRKTIESINDPSVHPPVLLVQEEDDISESEIALLMIFGKYYRQFFYNLMTPSVPSLVYRIRETHGKDELIKLYLELWRYHINHGVLPDQLDELVPEYVDELPVDLYAKGQTFQYDRENGLIFSAGIDEAEDLKISLGFVD